MPGEVIELLREDPDLLAVADAIVAVGPAPVLAFHRQTRVRVVAAVALAAVLATLAALLLSSPARGSDDIKRAEAAASGGPRVELVVTLNGLGGVTGTRRIRIDGLYDTRSPSHSVVRLTGVDKLVQPRLPEVRSLVADFATQYHRALASGLAEVTQKTAAVIWIRLTVNKLHYEVAVDRTTYRPRLIRVVPRGAKEVVVLTVLRFHASA